MLNCLVRDKWRVFIAKYRDSVRNGSFMTHWRFFMKLKLFHGVKPITFIPMTRKPQGFISLGMNGHHNSGKLFSWRVIWYNWSDFGFFKIIADRYRNRRKRFALKFNLIASIYNFAYVFPYHEGCANQLKNPRKLFYSSEKQK